MTLTLVGQMVTLNVEDADFNASAVVDLNTDTGEISHYEIAPDTVLVTNSFAHVPGFLPNYLTLDVDGRQYRDIRIQALVTTAGQVKPLPGFTNYDLPQNIWYPHPDLAHTSQYVTEGPLLDAVLMVIRDVADKVRTSEFLSSAQQDTRQRSLNVVDEQIEDAKRRLKALKNLRDEMVSRAV